MRFELTSKYFVNIIYIIKILATMQMQNKSLRFFVTIRIYKRFKAFTERVHIPLYPRNLSHVYQ